MKDGCEIRSKYDVAFDEWLYEFEVYGMRVERLSAEMRDPVDKLLPWLKAAFDMGVLAAQSTPAGDC